MAAAGRCVAMNRVNAQRPTGGARLFVAALPYGINDRWFDPRHNLSARSRPAGRHPAPPGWRCNTGIRLSTTRWSAPHGTSPAGTAHGESRASMSCAGVCRDAGAAPGSEYSARATGRTPVAPNQPGPCPVPSIAGYDHARSGAARRCRLHRGRLQSGRPVQRDHAQDRGFTQRIIFRHSASLDFTQGDVVERPHSTSSASAGFPTQHPVIAVATV